MLTLNTYVSKLSAKKFTLNSIHITDNVQLTNYIICRKINELCCKTNWNFTAELQGSVTRSKLGGVHSPQSGLV